MLVVAINYNYKLLNDILDIKKQTQELYGLINYGEFRKKMGCVTEKTSLKLNELVITGFTHLRVKGKNVHIRTPRCRALRRLNQLEGMYKLTYKNLQFHVLTFSK